MRYFSSVHPSPTIGAVGPCGYHGSQQKLNGGRDTILYRIVYSQKRETNVESEPYAGTGSTSLLRLAGR